MTRSRGFTLIELMIAVAIIAILAAIAIPSYTDYVRRGRLTDSVSKVAAMRVKMEQYFQDNRVYNAVPPACDLTSLAPRPADTVYFQYTCPTLTASQYTILAKGIGTMDHFQYTLDEAGNKLTVEVPPGWNLPPVNNCWAIKPDGSC